MKTNHDLVITTLAYLRDGERTLMLRRPSTDGYERGGRYNGLGGKFEQGESPEECLRREIHEEAGVLVEEFELKGIITFPGFFDGTDCYMYVYIVTKWSGELVGSDEGELEWHPTDTLADLPLYEGDRVFLPWLEQDRFFSAVFRYDQYEFQSYEVTFYGPDPNTV